MPNTSDNNVQGMQEQAFTGSYLELLASTSYPEYPACATGQSVTVPTSTAVPVFGQAVPTPAVPTDLGTYMYPLFS
jgi:hypothetical protein